jgi:ABC-type amino acid transport substrate-binding protein
MSVPQKTHRAWRPALNLRRRAVVVVILAGAAALAAGLGWWGWSYSREDLVWKHVQERKVFTVATDASYPPFEATDSNGNLFGFDIDLADAIGRQWGVQVQYEAISYDALLDAVISGHDDAVISALVPQPDRLKEVSFTQAYFTGGTVAVMPKSASANKIVKDWSVDGAAWAAGQTLAVERGASGDALARQWARNVAGVTVLPEPTAEEALLAVDNQAAQAALVDRIDAYNFLLSHPALTIVEPPVEPEPYTVAVSARSRMLFQAVQKALQALEADGTLSALRVKWLGAAAK